LKARIPGLRGPLPEVALGLSGTLHTFPLPELLQWLGSAKKNGTLSVRGDRYTKRLVFREGIIISSSSDDPTEQLGQFLLSHGKITEEDLRKGLETQTRTKVLLGKILLMVGAVEEEDLRDLLIKKAEETIFSLFLWSDAHFEFADGDLPKEVFVPIEVEVHDVLMKGLTIVDELKHVREMLGSSASVVALGDTPVPDGFAKGRETELAVLGQVDGKRTITDICLALHAPEFTVSKMLNNMLEAGYVKVVEKVQKEDIESEQAFLPPDELITKGREALKAGRTEDAVDLLARAVEESPRDLELKKLYDEACEKFREYAYQNSLAPDKVPVLMHDFSELTAEKLKPEEGFLISRINGSWDLKSIIDISPLSEVEALRIMKRLLDRGIIELR
jgi:hypothetical protein